MTGLATAWDLNTDDRQAKSGRLAPTRREAQGGPHSNVYTCEVAGGMGHSVLCKSQMTQSKGRWQKECKESTLRLDYDEEEREEGELSDTEEVTRQQEQTWWKERGQERGG